MSSMAVVPDAGAEMARRIELKLQAKAARKALFAGLNDPSNPATLLENAAEFATRTKIKIPVLNHLFALSRYQHLGRDRWDQTMKLGIALDQLLNQFFFKPIPAVIGLFDRKAMARTIVQIQPKTVMLTYHGSYAGLVYKLFEHCFGKGYILQDLGRGSHGEVLFAAMRTLLDSQPVYIAPDAGTGNKVRRGTVCGAEVDLSIGAAFLAYETRSYTGFFYVGHGAQGFAPKFIHGPRRAEGESFASFEERLLGFYVACLEQVFTGDPADIGLRGRWTAYFDTMLRARADIARA